MREIKEIIIHCSETPNGRDDRAEDVHRWHLERGWDGIGYHYCIRVNGMREVGRPEYWVGSHAYGHNEESIAILLFGTDKFSDGQWDELELLVSLLKLKYPIAKVKGHNEVSDKPCPNFDVKKWYKKTFIQGEAK